MTLLGGASGPLKAFTAADIPVARCRRANPVLNEFYRVAFRKKIYRTISELQADLDI